MSGTVKKTSLIERVGELYSLLSEYFPEHRSKQGVLDVPGLARDMGFAHETLYRCVRTNVIKVPVAHKILEFSHENHPEQPLYWQDLMHFVLPDYEKFHHPTRS